MTSTPIFMGEWNGVTVYNSPETPAGYTDEVEFEGALWVANFYNIDQNPMWYSQPPGQTTSPYSPGEPGYPWSLAPGSQVNFNTVVPSWAPAERLVGGTLTPTPILTAGATSSSSVSLFWQAAEVLGVGEVSSYDVYATNDSTGVTTLAGTTTSTNFTVSGLSTATKYTFTVDANDLTGTSGTQTQTGTAYDNAYTWNENPGAGPNPTVTVTTSGSQVVSGRYFSPYLDMTLPTTDLATISQNSGLRSFTLAFMQTTVDANGNVLLTDGAPSISWGGLGARTTESTGTMIQEVKQVQAEGGVVTISIGGYNGLDAAVYAAGHGLTAARLEAEYQAVVSTYGVDSLDFDIENTSTVNNYAANKLRDQAIVLLEKANPGLQVSYTVATTPTGLATLPDGEPDTAANDAADPNSNDLGVLQQAVADGVKLHVVNIMAMDYYDGNPNESSPTGTGLNAMYTDAVTAAEGTEKQLQTLGLATSTKIGITPMIGQNDDYNNPSGTNGEVFTLADAVSLEAFAASTPYVAGLGEWELPRDSASTTTDLGVAPTSTASGIVQTAYQFADDFAPIQTLMLTNVAGFEAAPAGALASSYAISDKESNIVGGLAYLEAHQAAIATITATDSTVSVTLPEFTADQTVLNKTVDGFGIYASSTSIQSDLAQLEADVGHIDSIAAETGIVAVDVATFKADEAVLNKVAPRFNIVDTSTNIAANFGVLSADVSHILGVAITGADPVLNLTQAQATTDAALVAKIADPSYVLNVTGGGATTTTGHGNGLTIDAVAGGQDTITGGGTSETFVFTPNFGQDTLTDFAQHYASPGNDIIQLPSSEFANFAAVLSDATYTSSAATITDHANGDKLVLQNVTQSMLTAAQSDFKFA